MQLKKRDEMRLQASKYLLIISIVFVAICVFISCKKPDSFEYREMRDFKIDSLGFGKSTIKMNLVYFNPNNFGVDLKHIDCDVFLDNKFLGKYLLDTTMHINKRSEFVVPSTMQVDMKNLFRNSLHALLSKELDIQLKGNTKLGKGGIYINIPFTYQTKVNPFGKK